MREERKNKSKPSKTYLDGPDRYDNVVHSRHPKTSYSINFSSLVFCGFNSTFTTYHTLSPTLRNRKNFSRRIKRRDSENLNFLRINLRFSGLMDQVVAEDGLQHVELLPAVNDDFGGVIVEMKEPMEPEAFRSQLRASISLWKLQGKRGVWTKLPIALVNLVETAVQEGFRYHHAEPDYLMLVYWIPETANTLPANATHRVVVGAIVMNDKRELLVVQEKCGKFRGTGVWKIPTGTVDEGEDLFAAAVREVKEETGIDAEFLEILAFRQFHKSFFDKSDLFFICMMRPLSFDIQKQESEIEAAQWMQFEEYAAQPFTQKHGVAKYTAEICLAKLEREYVGFSPLPIGSFFDDQISYLYLNSHDLIKK